MTNQLEAHKVRPPLNIQLMAYATTEGFGITSANNDMNYNIINCYNNIS
jgi:hypothetical protein